MKKRHTQQKRDSYNHKSNFKAVEVGVKSGTFTFTGPMSIADFASKINIQASNIIKDFFMKGKMFNPNSILDEEQIAEICLENNLDFKKEKVIDESNYLESMDDIIAKDRENPTVSKVRPPIVTIMGHVDHGKTTLLDTIRKTSVVSGESGGITQHIGAYQVKHNDHLITFIDTPGHAAFTEMRSRGANVTDIVILVVAADDGMMPQTEEAIDHARAAKVPILVFINKMDKPEANPDKVMSMLSEKDLMPEDWGGQTIYCKGSAKKGTGIPDLLESIVLLAEVQDYKANPDRMAIGTVIESHLDKGFGPVATLLVQTGTLRTGDIVLVGTSYGKIRSIQNDKFQNIKEAPPSTPVFISGLDSVPKAGDRFIAFKNEEFAKNLAMKGKQAQKDIDLVSNTKEVNQLDAEGKEIINKDVNLIIKTDVHGSAEAIKGMIEKLTLEIARVKIIRIAVGPITETDVTLAKTSNATIFSFNIRPSAQIREVAEKEKVKIIPHTIIYKLKEDVEALLKGALDPIFEEKIIGEARVVSIFKHSKIGTIAGSLVTDGIIKRNASARLIRDGIVIFDKTTVSSLKRFKEDSREVKKDTECGITLDRYNDIKEGDIIECFVNEQVER